MKVAFVTSFPDDPDAPHGGVEAVSVVLVQGLAKCGDLDVHVITARRGCKLPQVEQWGEVTVHRLPWAGGSMLRNAVGPGRRQMTEYLKKLKPDVIHAHDTYGLMVQNISSPRVFTVHGFIHADTALSAGCLALPRSFLWRLVELRGWSRHPHIISISPYVREKIISITRGSVHDIDNPVQSSFFDVERKDKGHTAFFAGVMTRLKNPLVILQAADLLGREGCRISVRLAGRPCDSVYYSAMRDFVARAGLQANVVFLGELNRQRILCELAAASVFVLPSMQENAPASIVEAMAAGVPVVTSNRCGMPYMVRDGESGFLVNPNDPCEIASRLRQLLTNDQLRQSMGAKGREIALDRFHPAKVAARTREVYLQAVSEHRH